MMAKAGSGLWCQPTNQGWSVPSLSMKACNAPYLRRQSQGRQPTLLRPSLSAHIKCSTSNTGIPCQDASRVLSTSTEAKLESDSGCRLDRLLGLTTLFIQVYGPAFAEELPRYMPKEIPQELPRFSPAEWIDIYVTSGVSILVYLIIIPLIIYNYLRLRWYKRSAAETIFQFLLVFLFFPGLLLLAPFINFRRLPKDGTEPP